MTDSANNPNEIIEQDTIVQSDVNKAVWAACDTFRGVISADTYKDFVLTMLFLKYISDVYRDEYNKLTEQYGDNPDLINAMMGKQRFVLPTGTSFWDLHEQRHQAGNGQRIDQALHAIEEANGGIVYFGEVVGGEILIGGEPSIHVRDNGFNY